MQKNRRKALRDLRFFFESFKPWSENLDDSGAHLSKYIWISCLFKNADSGESSSSFLLFMIVNYDNVAKVDTSCSQMESLEVFWMLKDIIDVGLPLPLPTAVDQLIGSSTVGQYVR